MDFNLIDAPEPVEIEYRQVEDTKGTRFSRPFVHFRWHDADIWLLGKVDWHDLISIGMPRLRLPRGEKIYHAKAVVHPSNSPFTFSIARPPSRQGLVKGTDFVFLGFDPRAVVDMDFVREEDARLSALPHLGWREKPAKLARPPSGLIV